MEKALFHGSERVVQEPVFGIGNPRNDYGLGFYCTESQELAKEWASSESSDGFSNHYWIDFEGLSILNINTSNYNILNWLAILLENREFTLHLPVAIQGRRYLMDNFLPDYKDADIIIGYRADDSYFSFAKAFLDNSISLEQLKRAMYLGKLGEQIVIKSREAFDRLTFIAVETVDSAAYYPKKKYRDQTARNDYFKMLKETPVEGATYLTNIINDKWDNNDPRL